MASIDWPSTLPQSMEKTSYSLTPQSGVIRTDMETGYAKQRRRFTATVKTMSGATFIMDKDQLDIFETWFYDTLGIVNYFNLPDPRDVENSTIEVRITDGTYSVTPESDTLFWEVSLNLEMMP